MSCCSDGYCRNDHVWRSGLGCSLLGACVVIGSEASVFALTIITTVRINAVGRLFGGISIGLVCIFLSLAWLVAIALAVSPLFPSADEYFVESVWYKENLFGTTADREDLVNHTVRMVAQLKISADFVAENGGVGSWSLFEALMKKLNPEYTVHRRFGYYSSHGVCLPRLFPNKQEDASWGFSLVMIMTNFIAFLFIVIGYIIIYRKATKVTASEEAAAKRGVKLQRKLTMIVLTDFCCWVPICIMTFLQLNGIDIPKEVYVPTGSIMIPINSAINPFLYSNLPAWLGKKLYRIRRVWHRGYFSSILSRTSLSRSVKTEEVEMKESREEDGNRPAAAIDQMVVEVEVEEKRD